MGILIKVADSTEELDAAFRLRYRVFVEQEGYMPANPQAMILDRFDAFPSSAIIVGVVAGQVVASVRVAGPSPVGLPADEFFDFRPHLPETARAGSMSLFCAEREHRRTPRLSFAILAVGSYWALARGLTHLVAPANPILEKYLRRMGFRAVAPEFLHHEQGLPTLPVVLDLQAQDDGFLSFVRRQGMEHHMSSFLRQFHPRGDVVFRRGDVGDAAYVVIEGEAEVHLNGPDGDEHLATLGPGAIFGELALLTPRPRTATVIARSELDLMVLPRDAFLAKIRSDPDAAQAVLELVAGRMADTLERRPPPAG